MKNMMMNMMKVAVLKNLKIRIATCIPRSYTQIQLTQVRLPGSWEHDVVIGPHWLDPLHRGWMPIPGSLLCLEYGQLPNSDETPTEAQTRTVYLIVCGSWVSWFRVDSSGGVRLYGEHQHSDQRQHKMDLVRLEAPIIIELCKEEKERGQRKESGQKRYFCWGTSEN